VSGQDFRYSRLGPILGGLLILAVSLYWLTLRPRLLRWGATDGEVNHKLPGDDVVTQPRYLTTRAVIVHAPASQVWPWLVQIGFQRGGLYSYDWLDRLFGVLDRPSADRILAEFQHLEPGDVIPLGNGPDWPVQAVVPERALVLAPEAPGVKVSWAFVLEETGDRKTRLISQVRGTWAPSLLTDLSMRAVLEPQAFIMERRMLLGIKERAERRFASLAPVPPGKPVTLRDLPERTQGGVDLPAASTLEDDAVSTVESSTQRKEHP
jgi:hypothetical protein